LTGEVAEVEVDSGERVLVVAIAGRGCHGVLRVPERLLAAAVGDEIQLELSR
jgi:hypothetical protein